MRFVFSSLSLLFKTVASTAAAAVAAVAAGAVILTRKPCLLERSIDQRETSACFAEKQLTSSGRQACDAADESSGAPRTSSRHRIWTKWLKSSSGNLIHDLFASHALRPFDRLNDIRISLKRNSVSVAATDGRMDGRTAET